MTMSALGGMRRRAIRRHAVHLAEHVHALCRMRCEFGALLEDMFTGGGHVHVAVFSACIASPAE